MCQNIKSVITEPKIGDPVSNKKIAYKYPSYNAYPINITNHLCVELSNI